MTESKTGSSHSSSGVGFVGLLTLLFIGLKLGHVIDWSWWWVLSPSLISVGLVLLAALLYVIADAALPRR